MHDKEGTDPQPIGKLTYTTQLVLYLDAENGVDTLKDGRGFSADKPWKTLFYAWSFIRTNLQTFDSAITIHFRPGVYKMEKDHYSGMSFNAVILDGTNDGGGEVTIESINTGGYNTTVTYGTCFFYGGNWSFRNISFRSNTRAVVSVGYGATLYIKGCTFHMPDGGDVGSTGLYCGDFGIIHVQDSIKFKYNNFPSNKTLRYLMSAAWHTGLWLHSGTANKITIEGLSDKDCSQLFVFGAGIFGVIGDSSAFSPVWTCEGAGAKMGGIWLYGGAKAFWNQRKYEAKDMVSGEEVLKFSEMFTVVRAVAVSDSVEPQEEYTSPYEDLFAALDAEYRRVGILK